MSSATTVIFVSVILALSLTFCESAVETKSLYPKLNISRAGICSFEVPTIELISAEDRAAGVRPQGNGTKPGHSRIEICCSGWERKPHSYHECQPVCAEGCENGNCTAPNVCTCNRGYIKHENKCIPTCPIGCLNGVCTVQGVCDCNAGYQLTPDRKLCTPICSGGCGIGGECVAAETCKCKTGFSLNSTTRRCDYHCEGGCGGGTCIGPNKCSCQRGYILLQDKCTPECPKGCKNGVCSAPGVCKCASGWTLEESGSECKPHCKDPCLNGDCTGPNTCTCKRGYVADPREPSGNKCVAHCPGGCENGTCTAPNFCICNAGFMKEAKGSNRCVRRVKRSPLMRLELIPEQSDK